MGKKKGNKIGEYIENGKIIDIIPIGATTYKSQTRDNKGRYIHVNAKRSHIDDLEKRKGNKNLHLSIKELKTIPIKNLPKTIPLLWNYKDFCVGTKVSGLEIEKHRGSITIKGDARLRGELLIGSPDHSQIWY